MSNIEVFEGERATNYDDFVEVWIPCYESFMGLLPDLLLDDLDKEVVEFRLQRIQHSLHHVTEQRFIELCLEAGFKAPIRFFQSTIYMGWILEKV